MFLHAFTIYPICFTSIKKFLMNKRCESLFMREIRKNGTGVNKFLKNSLLKGWCAMTNLATLIGGRIAHARGTSFLLAEKSLSELECGATGEYIRKNYQKLTRHVLRE